jgi:hypothetical protein
LWDHHHLQKKFIEFFMIFIRKNNN